MNQAVEKIIETIDRKLNAFGAVDRINIILEIREHLDTIEREAMIEEYSLDPEIFEHL